MSIAENIARIKASLPAGVELVAVSKTHPAERVLEAYRSGQRIFGENKVQEMCAKYEALPKDIEWHLIGHLQSNKVKYVVPFVRMIHSVDSPELLRRIDAAAQRVGRTLDCLLEVRIAEEDTKFGMEGEQAVLLALDQRTRDLKNVRVRGLMGMASNTSDQGQVRREFETLKALSDRLKAFGRLDVRYWLSMGMSGDYPLAVACGSTLVRVGSSIFGHRDYGAGK